MGEQVKIKVLVVEDNIGDFDLIEAYLEDAKDVECQLFHVTSLADAKAQLTDTDIDLILLDMGLPDSSGLDGLQALKSGEQTNAAIVMLTGLNDDKIGMDAIHFGAQDYLIKNTLNTNKLNRTIRYATERQSLQKKLNQALIETQEAQNIVNRCINNASVGIWDINLTTNSMYVSSQWQHMLGYEETGLDDAEGWWQSLIHPDDLPRVLEIIAYHDQNHTRRYNSEHRLKHSDGHWVWVLSSGATTRAEDGTALFRSGTTVDITERKNLEVKLSEALTELEEKDALKDIFLANISHDIRTPMNAVLGFTELMLSQIKENKIDLNIFHQHLQTIHNNGKMLNGLLSDLLEISRLQSGDVTITKSTFSLWELLESSGKLFYGQAKEKGLDVFFDFDPAVPHYFHTDADRLRRIVFNLISNAVKYTENGSVKLSAFVKNDSLFIQISDTGYGISDADKERLFQPYERNEAHASEDGLGLGLPICRGLITLMGGEISVHDNVGGGTTFCVQLPISAKKFSPATLSHPVNVLCVSEDVELLEKFESIIGTWGGSFTSLHTLPNQVTDFDHIIIDATLSKSIDFSMFFTKINTNTQVALLQEMLTESDMMASINQADMHRISMLTSPLCLSDIHIFLERSTSISQIKDTDEHVKELGGLAIAGKILVVEDNPVNQAVIQGMLNNLGLHFDVASNGKQALDLYAAHRHPIVLLDLNLPDVSGKEVAKGIRELEQSGWGQAYISALTADARPELRDEIPQLDAFMTKPVSIGQLRSTLQSWLLLLTTVNHEQLDSMFEILGDKDAMQKFFSDVYQQLRNVPENILQHVKDGDHKATFQQAHILKGLTGYIGAERLSRRCETLCEMTRDEVLSANLEAIQECAYKIEREAKRVMFAIHMGVHLELSKS
jgi:PAS domain S-box-containing protein